MPKSGQIFRPQNAKKYLVKADDTLASIAEEEGISNVADIAWFNIGSDNVYEIERWLLEIVGSRTIPENSETENWKTFEFDGKEKKRGGTGMVFLPNSSKGQPHRPILGVGLAMDKSHKIVVERAVAPIAARIDDLDKWFIPGGSTAGGESTAIKHAFEGPSYRIDASGPEYYSHHLRVYGSNYAKSESWKPSDSRPAYPKLKRLAKAVPLYKASLDQTKGKTKLHSQAWDGVVTASEGLLASTKKKKRHINVAFSPYTVMVRVFKKSDSVGTTAATDAEARLELEPFWPRWKKQGSTRKVDKDSLKVYYKIIKCKRLKGGQIRIVDRKDKVIFAKRLTAKQLTEKTRHCVVWHGKDSDGEKISGEGMPFRAQIQVHRAANDPSGLGLAAMHTEVRLFVHPEGFEHKGVSSHENENSLRLSLGSSVHKAPSESSKSAWINYRLAQAGLPIGPIDVTDTDRLAHCLEIVQRAFPKKKGKCFARTKITKVADSDTVALLKGLPAGWRAVLGKDGKDLSESNARKAIRDKDSSLVVWADHRFPVLNPKAEAAWIPVEVELPLCPKEKDKEGDSGGLAAEANALNAATREAVGLLCIDWTFSEGGEDLGVVQIDYNKKTVRTHKWLEVISKRYADVQKGRRFANAPVVQVKGGKTKGGRRPLVGGKTDLANYYAVPFGSGGEGLAPWKAAHSSAKKALVTYVFEQLGQGAGTMAKEAVGKSGVYLCPSNIAGDSYTYQAKVSFGPFAAGFRHPNQKVLEARYPQRPAAHTPELRVWRKDSIKGFAYWSPDHTWPAYAKGTADYYEEAHIKLIHEGDRVSRPYRVNELVPAAAYAQFVKMAGRRHPMFKDLTQTKGGVHFHERYAWPFTHLPALGLPPGRPNETFKQYRQRVIFGKAEKFWMAYGKDILLLANAQYEQKTGSLAGHFVLQFRGSQKLALEQFTCDGCLKTRVESQNTMGYSLSIIDTHCSKSRAKNSNANGCPGRWRRASLYRCSKFGCGSEFTGVLVASSSGRRCKRGGCSGKMDKIRSVRKRYVDSYGVRLAGFSHGMHSRKVGCYVHRCGPKDHWAHELGHDCLLWHATGWKRGKVSPPVSKKELHDSQWNTNIRGARKRHTHGWDVDCIMAYSRVKPHFCGKCILRLRGWSVEKITNPPSGIRDS